MTPQTRTQKIFARAARVGSCEAGEVLEIVPDLITLHDGYAEFIWRQFEELGFPEIAHPERIFAAVDHEVHLTSPASARSASRLYQFCSRYGIEQYFGPGRGGNANVLPAEMGVVKPGDMVFAADVNAVNLGAVGAVAIPIGAAIGAPMLRETWWAHVPHTLKVELTGQLTSGAAPRDLATYVVQEIRREILPSGVPVTLEFMGELAHQLSIDDRMTLCHFAMHSGAFGAIFPPSFNLSEPDEYLGDPRAEYWKTISIHANEVKPTIKLPNSEQFVPIEHLFGVEIQQAVIGSCASGYFSDIELAAKTLKGKTVHPGVRLYVAPVTKDVFRRSEEAGYLTVLREAGAMVLEPGCGPCAGGKIGALSDGETAIATVSDNASGRFQATQAGIYLANAEIVAASAVLGSITDTGRLQ